MKTRLRFHSSVVRLSLTLGAPLCAVAVALVINFNSLAQSTAIPDRHRQAGDQRAAVIRSSSEITSYLYLPAITKNEVCGPIPGETYASIAPETPGPDPSNDNLINLARRGYEPVAEYKGLIDTANSGDPNNAAPQFPDLFLDHRLPDFSDVYALYKGDLSGLITNPPVTLVGLAATPGEIIRLPDSGYDIGGFDAMVLYADDTRLTAKYTRSDDVAGGYVVYLERVCVEPNLLSLYRQLNASGRAQLPALHGLQPLGHALGAEIGVAVRDQGTLKDPRVCGSWWVDYCGE
ncbi:MAG TPA: hypothetical protein VJG32_05205 [Anaerolineae bacterium]|nr:hypothetical protein [Anaerolineae bacterium]